MKNTYGWKIWDTGEFLWQTIVGLILAACLLVSLWVGMVIIKTLWRLA